MAKRSSKAYLQVETKLTTEGRSVPHELKYNDETFEITESVKSMKLFEGATRWRCKIDGRSVELFNIEDKWWMEK
jgi:hypothetical protein